MTVAFINQLNYFAYVEAIVKTFKVFEKPDFMTFKNLFTILFMLLLIKITDRLP